MTATTPVETTAIALPAKTALMSADGFKDLAGLATNEAFIPRLQVFAGNSKLVLQGKIGPGNWGVMMASDQVRDLGKEIIIRVYGGRSKALDVRDVIRVSYDPQNAVFAEIRALAEAKADKCMCGPEFLVWLGEIEMFATFFATSASAKREIKPLIDAVNPNIQSRVTDFVASSYLVSPTRGAYAGKSWFAPKFENLDLWEYGDPDPAVFAKKLRLFQNPTPSELEAAAASERER